MDIRNTKIRNQKFTDLDLGLVNAKQEEKLSKNQRQGEIGMNESTRRLQEPDVQPARLKVS